MGGTVTIAPAPEPPTSRPAEYERRRQEIAAAACRVLAERGLAGTSVRLIAREAGLSLGTLPHYFADKDELLLAAHRYSYESTTRRFYSRPGPHRGLVALEGLLEDSLPLDDERRVEWKVWLTFWGHAAYSSSVAEHHHRRYRRWRETIAEIVTSAQESGEIPRSVDPSREAEALVAFVDGLALQAMLEPAVFTPDRQLEILHSHVQRLRVAGG